MTPPRPTRLTVTVLGLVALLGLLPWQSPLGPLGESAWTGRHHCRFWGCLADTIPADVIRAQLVFEANSLRSLSLSNPHGWGMVHSEHPDSEVTLRRGAQPAHEDSTFLPAVEEMVASLPSVGIAHVRFCSSGLCSIPDPHPFLRSMNGRQWRFAHNGYIDKDYLMQLLREDFLAAHPPVNGAGLDEWIDSELYFLLVLQTLEEEGWDVKRALAFTIRRLNFLIPNGYEALNFVMSDGESVWSYRQGRTLYCVNVEGEQGYRAVASMYPGRTQGDWVSVEEMHLVTLEPGQPPLIEDIEDYYYPVSQDEESPPAGRLALACHPNPFNPSTRLSFVMPEAADAELAAYDLSGRRVATVFRGRLEAGRQELRWEPRGLSSGVYFLALEAAGRRDRARAVLLK